MRTQSIIVAAAASFALAATPTAAQEIHGFVEVLDGARTVDATGLDAGSQVARESRLQLRLSDATDESEYFVRLDVLADDLGDGSHDLELREAFFTWSGWNALDLKVGRQVLTWGTGDLLFINDVFPKDWESFFVGREDQYLKAPSDALRLGVFTGALDATLVLLPGFAPDRLPRPDRLQVFDPFPGAGSPEEPTDEIQNGEMALRLYRSLGAAELSLYGFRGRFRQPLAFDPARGRPFYPGLYVLGASLRAPLLGGISNLEIGYYDSRDDGSGDDAFVENSSLRWMVGHDRQLWADFQLGLQAYFEWMQDYAGYRSGLSPQAFVRDEVRQVYTLRLVQRLDYQTVTLGLFAFASPSDEDLYVRAHASYALSDGVQLTLGANVFIGQDRVTLFGQLDDNDNVYLRARLTF